MGRAAMVRHGELPGALVRRRRHGRSRLAWRSDRRRGIGGLELTHLPLSLLATMFVPLIIASHVFMLMLLILP